MVYIVIFFVLLACELLYFKIADKCNIVDKPNERSSHSTVVLRGGGIIFLIGAWVWFIAQALGLFNPLTSEALNPLTFYPFMLLGVTLAAGISFVDDIHSLPDSVRLVAQFVAMGLMFQELGILHLSMWWIVIIALVVCVGASNIINFMDGINGITGAYAMASLIPLFLLNREFGFVDDSLILTVAIADVVFCIFNFRPKGKAKCFAGDVGSIGVAYILLFLIGGLILKTGDVTYLIFLLVYGVDGCLTIVHRIMLHEPLGKAHRKHAYQLMANELKIGHVTVSSFYGLLQLVISLVFIYLIPDTALAHWIYLVCVIVLLSLAYVCFMKKYYHLHEEYLASIRQAQDPSLKR